MEGPSELWRMRKQFTLQLAGVSFMQYILGIGSRTPSRFHVSRATGNIAMSEVVPVQSSSSPVVAPQDILPFRFTFNMQRFVGPVFTEGVLAPSIMAIARCLTEPEVSPSPSFHSLPSADSCTSNPSQYELEQNLCLFSRDEVMIWLHSKRQPWNFDANFRSLVAENVHSVVVRAETMACKQERERVSSSYFH